MKTKARNKWSTCYSPVLGSVKRDGKPIWGKMNIIIRYYVIGVFEWICMSIRKNTWLFEKLFEENAEAWIGKVNIYHLLQLAIIGKKWHSLNCEAIWHLIIDFRNSNAAPVLYNVPWCFRSTDTVAINSHLPTRDAWSLVG